MNLFRCCRIHDSQFLKLPITVQKLVQIRRRNILVLLFAKVWFTGTIFVHDWMWGVVWSFKDFLKTASLETRICHWSLLQSAITQMTRRTAVVETARTNQRTLIFCIYPRGWVILVRFGHFLRRFLVVLRDKILALFRVTLIENTSLSWGSTRWTVIMNEMHWH